MGEYWKCDIGVCVPCPKGFYQPQWGQTSCWRCPANTTTDSEGATQPTHCKSKWAAPRCTSGRLALTDSLSGRFLGSSCPFYVKDGIGILESPNFPNEYPLMGECHWRVRPGRKKTRMLVIISHLHLDEACGDVLTIRKAGQTLIQLRAHRWLSSIRSSCQ